MDTVVYVASISVLGLITGFGLRSQVARFDVALPARLPILELACGVLFAIAAHRYDETWRMIPVLVLIATCVVLTVVDLACYRLPNTLLFPGLAASALLMVGGELVDGESSRIVQIAIGALLYSSVLFLVHMVNPAGLGFGDVKLALLLGAFLGWVSDGRLEAVRAVMIGLLIGSALGVVLGLGRMLVVRLGRDFLPDPVESDSDAWHKTTFPFGPPLMAGTIAIVLWPATFLG